MTQNRAFSMAQGLILRPFYFAQPQHNPNIAEEQQQNTTLRSNCNIHNIFVLCTIPLYIEYKYLRIHIQYPFCATLSNYLYVRFKICNMNEEEPFDYWDTKALNQRIAKCNIHDIQTREKYIYNMIYKTK